MMIFSHEELSKSFSDFSVGAKHWKDAHTNLVTADKLAVTLAAIDFMQAARTVKVEPICKTILSKGVYHFEYVFKVSSSGYGAD